MRGVSVKDTEKLYSVEKRKEIAKRYNEDEQMIIDMSRNEFMAFVVGAAAGEKCEAIKAMEQMVENPDIMINLINSMTEENRNKVLDAFCEPVEAVKENANEEG